MSFPQELELLPAGGYQLVGVLPPPPAGMPVALLSVAWPDGGGPQLRCRVKLAQGGVLLWPAFEVRADATPSPLFLGPPWNRPDLPVSVLVEVLTFPRLFLLREWRVFATLAAPVIPGAPAA